MKKWWWGALLLWVGEAHAKDLAALKTELASADDDKAIEAAHALAKVNEAKAVDAVMDALAVGAPPRVQAALLAALEGKKDSRTFPVARRYAHNRNAELRKHAFTILAELDGAKVTPLLMAGLSDPTVEVRAVSAQALAKRKEKAAIEPLLKLLEHKDSAAASALATLATADLAHRFAEMVGRVPDALFCQTLGEMLKRPDFGPEPIRVEVVKTLSKVPGADSTATLVEYIAATEKDKNRASRVEAQKIVEQRSGGAP